MNCPQKLHHRGDFKWTSFCNQFHSGRHSINCLGNSFLETKRILQHGKSYKMSDLNFSRVLEILNHGNKIFTRLELHECFVNLKSLNFLVTIYMYGINNENSSFMFSLRIMEIYMV